MKAIVRRWIDRGQIQMVAKTRWETFFPVVFIFGTVGNYRSNNTPSPCEECLAVGARLHSTITPVSATRSPDRIRYIQKTRQTMDRIDRTNSSRDSDSPTTNRLPEKPPFKLCFSRNQLLGKSYIRSYEMNGTRDFASNTCFPSQPVKNRKRYSLQVTQWRQSSTRKSMIRPEAPLLNSFHLWKGKTPRIIVILVDCWPVTRNLIFIFTYIHTYMLAFWCISNVLVHIRARKHVGFSSLFAGTDGGTNEEYSQRIPRSIFARQLRI